MLTSLQDQLDEITANTRDIRCFCRELPSNDAQWKQVRGSKEIAQRSCCETGRASTEKHSPFHPVTRKLIPPPHPPPAVSAVA